MDRIIKRERKNWFYSYNMLFNQDISVYAKIIYLYLCRCADSEGQAFPSHKNIANKCSIKTRQTVIKALKELGSIGLLEIEKRSREDGGQTSNLYIIYDEPINNNKVEHSFPPVYQVDTPCLPDRHPPVYQIDTPCLPDRHQEGLPNEVLPIYKDYPVNHSIKDNTGSKETIINDQTDGQTESLIILKTIEDKLQISTIKQDYPQDEKLIDEILLNISEMYFSNNIKIQGQDKPQDLIRSAINKLTYHHIDELIRKYKFLSSTTKITNHKSYIQSMIYSIAFEHDLSVTNFVNYNLV